MGRRKQHESGTASFAGFAKLIGERAPSYITQLKGEGRLVLTEDGKLPRGNRALVSDAIATMGGAVAGTSTTTSYIESSAGVGTSEGISSCMAA